MLLWLCLSVEQFKTSLSISSSSSSFSTQPSSAAAEGVFSVLNNSFGANQTNSLEDYVEATVMLQYNNRTV